MSCERGVHWESTPRLLFLSSDSRAAGILDLIHSDVCGPMYLASLNGSLYYVVFIDDFSRKS
jgi:hypothetical protein